jgi:hypothetical protein
MHSLKAEPCHDDNTIGSATLNPITHAFCEPSREHILLGVIYGRMASSPREPSRITASDVNHLEMKYLESKYLLFWLHIILEALQYNHVFMYYVVMYYYVLCAL